MAQAAAQLDRGEQLALHDGWMHAMRRRAALGEQPSRGPLCAGCREKEARYGFRDNDEDPTVEAIRQSRLASTRESDADALEFITTTADLRGWK